MEGRNAVSGPPPHDAVADCALAFPAAHNDDHAARYDGAGMYAT